MYFTIPRKWYAPDFVLTEIMLSFKDYTFPMLTGEQVRLLRQTRQVKQIEMARRIGISQQRYSALEKSKK